MVLKGSFAKAKALNVWFSDLASANDEGTNPPEAKVFQKLAPIVPGADGTVKLENVRPAGRIVRNFCVQIKVCV